MKLRVFTKTGVLSLAIATISVCGLRQTKAEEQTGTDPFVGAWAGAGASGKSPYKITLTVPALDKDGVSLTFGAPRSCTLKGKRSSKDGETLTVLFRDSNGGYCDKFINGNLVLTKSYNNSLKMVLSDETGKRKESSVLRLITPPAPAKSDKNKK